MKIVFYIGWLARGGAERVISTLANMLNKEGYSCIVVTSYKAENEYRLDEGVKRIVLVEGNKRNFLKDNIKQLWGLRKILKKEEPHTVVSFMGEPNFRMLIASIGISCRKIISVRNDPSKEYSRKLYRFLAKILFPMADHVVFQTEDAKKWFPERIQKKSSIIFNPVGETFFQMKYDGFRRNLVTTGRLVPQKNHELLIRAFAKVVNELDDDLYIYGDGPLKEHLIKLVHDLNLQDRVFLPGATKNVADEIKSARIFILSSDYEGLPNSLMEAMALGIPCLSTDCPCGGPKALLNEEYLFAKGDIHGLAKMLSKTRKASFFEKNYKVEVESFRLSNIYEKWINVLD
ncbi:glycosyltransferase [Fibrobacter sp.]|uniref:glycosyltransferase n=1 Tax=Fibrobacter sp. TaxID=35828 RepID=UPI003866E7B4